MDAVSEVLALRGQPADGLQRMLGASVAAHVAIMTALVLVPAGWLGHRAAPEPEAVMVVSLGGAPGPQAGGMSAMGGRPVQRAITPEAKRPEPVRAPAAREPEMIEPRKEAPKRAEVKVPSPAKTPASRTPTTGEEERKGTAVAETFGRGQGFGLATGGGGTGSYIDTANFCCPEYLTLMTELINQNWQSNQQAAGTVVVKYTIQPDGVLTGVVVEKSSGYATLDLLAQRALLLTRKLPPLPAAFTEPSLTVHLVFEYRR